MNKLSLIFTRVPLRSDPRIPAALALLTYVIIGITVLGFNRSPGQIAVIVLSACALDMVFAWLIRRERLFPFSGLISGLGLSILVNTAHGLWYPLIPVFCAIASKYLITINGRHVYNPTLFGLIVGIVVTAGMISPSPAYQWGGYTALGAFIVTAALFLFVFKIKRNALILSFLFFYAMNVGIRAWLTRWHVPPETIILGTLTSPAFYLFTFFMLTDPATSPSSVRGQVLMAFCIAALDLYLHKFEVLYTLFKAAFIYCTLVWVTRIYTLGKAENLIELLGKNARAPVMVSLIVALMLALYAPFRAHISNAEPGFFFKEISAQEAGISSSPGTIFENVDPRVRHVAKWLLSVGDAVAVADVNRDGLQDFFLTYPLKDTNSRAALYINLGNFQFKRHALPVLDEYIRNPKNHGLPSGALWFDYDNDTDQDLLLLTGYGNTRLLHNNLIEKGGLEFEDISGQSGVSPYTISLTANALDVDKDGRLDLIIGNSMQTHLQGYEVPTPFTIFDLPQPEFENDRRMFNFMHRTWHNADNGGENLLLLNTGKNFVKADNAEWGVVGTRWTLAIGTGDLNNDGWTDLYLANDFGPDQMMLNRRGRYFEEVKGRFVGELGRDTYKGMNSTIADLDQNGFPDIYISNVHEPLQAEGSLLWFNNGRVDQVGAKAFQDVAAAKNALNEDRFGWGAAAGDLDRDGTIDLVQANGMVDDAYDQTDGKCLDYWYWNEQIALTPPSVHGYADSWADLRGRCIFPDERNRVYLNKNGYFVDVADKVGWERGGTSRGIALADLDNDGDLDALVTRQFAPVSIYRNDSMPKNWLGLKMIGNGKDCSRDALGTKLRLSFNDQGREVVQYREMSASNGFSAQGESRILFGLGRYQGAVKVEVEWCANSASRQLLSPALNRYHVIEQADGPVKFARTDLEITE